MLRILTRVTRAGLSEIGRPFLGFLTIATVVIFTAIKELPQLITFIVSPFTKFSIKTKSLLLPMLLFSLASISLLAAWGLYTLRDLPDVAELETRELEASSKIYDREGNLMYTIFDSKNRTLAKLKDIPIHLQLATLAAEDHEFYNHPGISLRGMGRAVIKYFKEGEITGGSTITQQLIKNALLTPEQTIERKLKEIALAMWAEQYFTKEEILEMYLNEVSYGGTAYGIREGARQYFDKKLNDVTLAEAALLAGLTKAPSEFSPFKNQASAKKRAMFILKSMHKNGFITDKQYAAALTENVVINRRKIEIASPHFVFYIKELLEQKYGARTVNSGGLSVMTTLDPHLQALAEKAIGEELAKISHLNVENAAALIMNAKTGEVLAMAGSRDYFNGDVDGQVNVTFRPRQPGSSIKVVNYAYALSNGMTPATVVEDTPITFHVRGVSPYSPENYDDSFRGPLTIRSALAESRNVPAVKVLSTYGVNKMVDLGRRMGITTWDNPDNYGLSLTLGGGEVRLFDLARVYATIANYGKRPPVVTVKSIVNRNGEALHFRECVHPNESRFKIADAEASNAHCPGEQVLDPRVAFQIIDILKDDSARAPAFGSSSALVIAGHPEVAVKTGTSNNLRDNLAIGFNQDYVVAVWVGNNDNSPMSRVASGITGASPIFNKIMSVLLAGRPSKEWEVPSGLVRANVCGVDEWFLEGTQNSVSCATEASSDSQI